MHNEQRIAVLMLVSVMGCLTIPAWADRDDQDERRFQREQRVPPRDERRGGHVETQDRDREQRREIRVPPAQPAPSRDVRPSPEKLHPPGVTGRPIGPVPAPLPIKNWREEPKPPREPPRPGWVLDTKFRHNHYYPPRGVMVDTLPPASRVIVHQNEHYHYHDGVWYRRHNSRFIVVIPPFGILVPILPPFYTTIWVGSNIYYYAGGVYYTWWPAYQQYVVVEAPADEKVRVAPDSASEQLYIYPAAGQSEEQQAKDRYECHRWAQSETGFDPTTPGGGVPAEQHASKRNDYYRAMKACLEARHYSVQ